MLKREMRKERRKKQENGNMDKLAEHPNKEKLTKHGRKMLRVLTMSLSRLSSQKEGARSRSLETGNGREDGKAEEVM